MKVLYIVLMMIFSSSLVAMGNNAFAYNANSVEILNIHTQPSTIKVGDKFTITATLVNNSTIPIFVETSDDCGGPFTMTFDDHVTVNHSNLTCPYSLFIKMLNSNGKITKTSPGPMLTFRATTLGLQMQLSPSRILY